MVLVCTLSLKPSFLISGAGGGALVYPLMQYLYTSSNSNLSPSHLLMAGVMITASETPCSLRPSCDGTVQRPTKLSPSHLLMSVPVMGSAQRPTNVIYTSSLLPSQGLTDPLTPSPSSQLQQCLDPVGTKHNDIHSIYQVPFQTPSINAELGFHAALPL